MKISEMIFAALGVVGTLSGVVVGHVSAMRATQTQLEHEDRTRYQELRFAAYSEFANHAMDISRQEMTRGLSMKRIESDFKLAWQGLTRPLPAFNCLAVKKFER